ncbi:MAG: AI-2E family transporter [Planctomycetes bacterium]|nr:AI-2E family transporter [Planctomycetota bacterium]
MSNQRIPGFVLLLVGISSALLAILIAPFAASFFAAAVLAGVMHPAQEALAARLGGRGGLAALLLTIGVVVLVVGPMAGLCVFVAKQATALFATGVETYRERGVEGLIETLPEPLKDAARWLVEHWPGGFRVLEGSGDQQEVALSGTQIEAATGVVAAVLDGLATVLIDLGVLVVTLFFLLHQGRRLVDWVVEALPLSNDEGERLVREFRDVTRAVFGATIATALLQTAIAWAGYAIAGIPYQPIALLLTFVCAVIPVVGAAALVILIGGLLWLDGQTGYGVFLILWGALPVGLSDNIAKPWIAKGKMRLPGSVVLFSMLGGVVVFGAFGIVAGPLIVAFFLASLRLLERREGG